MNKFQWNFKQYTIIFIQDNWFEISSAKRRPFFLICLMVSPAYTKYNAVTLDL